MTKFRNALAAIAIASGVLLPAITSPAAAAVDTSDPSRFVQTLTNDAFGAMKGSGREAAKAKFRALLAQNVAVDQIGDRLIRRWLPKITPAQHQQYETLLPGYVVGTYADRLFEYSDATVKVVRTQPTAGGGADVITQVVKPGGQPFAAIWSLTKLGGTWKVLNLNVAGINVAMAQAADFDSVIQRQGFDALLKMMAARK